MQLGSTWEQCVNFSEVTNVCFIAVCKFGCTKRTILEFFWSYYPQVCFSVVGRFDCTEEHSPWSYYPQVGFTTLRRFDCIEEHSPWMFWSYFPQVCFTTVRLLDCTEEHSPWMFLRLLPTSVFYNCTQIGLHWWTVRAFLGKGYQPQELV